MTLEIPDLDGWTEEDETLLKGLIQKRMSVKRDKGADLKFVSDMLDGETSERELLAIINGDVEVKTNTGVARYGSVYVEVMDGDKPSGITTTTSEWQAQVFAGDGYNKEIIILIKTERLRKIADKHYHIRGGRASRGAKVHKETLLMTDEEIERFR